MTDDTNKTKSFEPSSPISCSICLDLVTANGERSTAKLQCGHQFHLDCIGSAFNTKGAMQCPNCRKVERGRWLFANDSARSFPEFSMIDWIHDADPYELMYSEMPFRVHWCPFSGLTRVGSFFQEAESPATTYPDLQGHHSSRTHSYVAYIEPVPPASSNSNEIADDPNFTRRWPGVSGRNDILAPHVFPALDGQYQIWGRNSPSFSTNSNHINGADQASVPPATLRSSRAEPDAIRIGSFVHPFPYGHGSMAHSGSNAGLHERIQVPHVIHHQLQPTAPSGMASAIIPRFRRFGGPRGMPPVVPAAPPSEHSGGVYFFPPAGPSSRTAQEAENPLPIRDASWEPFRHATSGSNPGNRSGSFRQRYWS